MQQNFQLTFSVSSQVGEQNSTKTSTKAAFNLYHASLLFPASFSSPNNCFCHTTRHSFFVDASRENKQQKKLVFYRVSEEFYETWQRRTTRHSSSTFSAFLSVLTHSLRWSIAISCFYQRFFVIKLSPSIGLDHILVLTNR